ncbi:DUF3576 domain-containing protein [Rhodobacteraceae bacterium F11138]|nr:DUF3576 domain-containing protein [Rhodobacteraceae bacterium F11138]
MTLHNGLKVVLVASLCLALTGCGNRRSGNERLATAPEPTDFVNQNPESAGFTGAGGSTIWDIFGPNTTEQTVNVNRYLWAASLEVLNFLPVSDVDPFTGVIITGYGTPPGGGRSYRATVHIKDPALDARSLTVALHTKGGPVSAGTTRAVEDAILSRARQLRVNDARL